MDPLTLAMVEAAIASVFDVVKQLNQGAITEQQAQDYLKAVGTHYSASRVAWDAASV